LGTVLLITFGNTFGPLLAAHVLRDRVSFTVTFERIQDVITFALVGALAASLISALIGTLALIIGGSVTTFNAGNILLEWFMGDSIGTLILTPLIMLWWKRHQIAHDYQQWLEIAALGICVVAV